MAIVGLTREGAGELSQAESVPRRAAAPFRVVELASSATAACGRLLAEAGCDVVKVEPPGGAPERNAGLVLVSVTAFGQDGPYSQYAANDLTVFAMGGLMFISGQPGEPPVV